MKILSRTEAGGFGFKRMEVSGLRGRPCWSEIAGERLVMNFTCRGYLGLVVERGLQKWSIIMLGMEDAGLRWSRFGRMEVSFWVLRQWRRHSGWGFVGSFG